ncbi:MAG: hypothetical protein LBU47_01900 [Christensenellaceae bacterium]|jgi:hypothetical protein|nr:hypothetical protein [Christensenellaceae bacterium]
MRSAGEVAEELRAVADRAPDEDAAIIRDAAEWIEKAQRLMEAAKGDLALMVGQLAKLGDVAMDVEAELTPEWQP